MTDAPYECLRIVAYLLESQSSPRASPATSTHPRLPPVDTAPEDRRPWGHGGTSLGSMLRSLCLWVLPWLALSCAHVPSAPGLVPGEHQRVLNGVRLYYRIAGEPPHSRSPVLFLHGGPGDNSYAFARLMGSRLEPLRRMVYLDQRGCGRSERPWEGHYSLARLVEDVEALRQALGVERWVLLGHSLGGALALEYAARYPEHVAGLVLVGALSDSPASLAVWQRELERRHPGRLEKVRAEGSHYARLMQALQGVDAPVFFRSLQFHDPQASQQYQQVQEESGLRNTGELAQALFGGELPSWRFTAHARVQAPALVVAGRHDYAVGVETMRTLAASLPQANFLEYEGSAHFPFVEEPDRFERDMAAFLSSVP